MLILIRRDNENIVIDGRIIVTAVRVYPDSAMIMVRAEGFLVRRDDSELPISDGGSLLNRGQSLLIGDKIVIKVLRCDRDSAGQMVKLGIQAPYELPVHRQEIYDAIQRSKKPRENLPPAS
jgi:carbon storage regulator